MLFELFRDSAVAVEGVVKEVRCQKRSGPCGVPVVGFERFEGVPEKIDAELEGYRLKGLPGRRFGYSVQQPYKVHVGEWHGVGRNEAVEGAYQHEGFSLVELESVISVLPSAIDGEGSAPEERMGDEPAQEALSSTDIDTLLAGLTLKQQRALLLQRLQGNKG